MNGSYTYKGLEQIEKGHAIIDKRIIDEAGEYEDVYYQLYHDNMAIFSSDASVLIFRYTPENYKSEQLRLERDYMFVDSSLTQDGRCLLSENEFTIGDWQFKACLSDGWTEFYYPKQFRLIGYNENESSIAYLDFQDDDLDCIEEPMEEFIDFYFNYDFSK